MRERESDFFLVTAPGNACRSTVRIRKKEKIIIFRKLFLFFLLFLKGVECGREKRPAQGKCE